mmetsp:Transcript_22907/g.47497  ORF Transcript_22907/g.47497 Transcript_22907/m.47497 type:complete len:254 (+) Transcript_22907:398-1159(+)
MPEALRYFSVSSFSSSTWPKALVTWKPGLFSCPQPRPLVKIDETRTILLTPDFLAASTKALVPRLSTACASAFIAKGLPGTKPVAMISASVPVSVAARVSTASLATSRVFSSTPLVSTAFTSSTIAPRMAMELLPSSLFALVTSRTPPITARPPCLAKRSTMRRPVCPVAPATSTVLASAAPAAPAPSTVKRAASRARRGSSSGAALRCKCCRSSVRSSALGTKACFSATKQRASSSHGSTARFAMAEKAPGA